MIEQKLKEELLKKIVLLEDLSEKIRQIEEENPDSEYEELEENTEYLEVMEQRMYLRDEIDTLLIETKYFPLSGLSSEQIKSIPEGPKFLPEVYQSTGKIKSLLVKEELIEKYLDFELLKLRDEMKRRVGKLKTLKLGFDIDSWTRHLYKQVTQCFTYGFFESCCILCRAIVESIAKRYIDLKGYREYLVGKEKDKKPMTLMGILKKLGVSINVITSYRKISDKADNILHNKDSFISEKDALLSIDALHLFIKEFPKMI